jgi:hypothetical protein
MTNCTELLSLQLANKVSRLISQEVESCFENISVERGDRFRQTLERIKNGKARTLLSVEGHLGENGRKGICQGGEPQKEKDAANSGERLCFIENADHGVDRFGHSMQVLEIRDNSRASARRCLPTPWWRPR